MKPTKDQILGAMATLGPADLQAIKALATALLAKAEPVTLDTPHQWLLEALRAVMTHSHLGFGPGVEKHLSKHGAAFIAFIADNFDGVLNNKVEALAVMRTLLRLICDDLRRLGIPITPTTVATHLPRTASIFDRAFPGYLQSRLAKLAMGALPPSHG